MILFLPKWYPSRLDPQLGLFIQKHAMAAAVNHRVVVLSVHADDSLRGKFELEDYEEGDLRELRTYYRRCSAGWCRVVNLYRYLKSFQKAWRLIQSTEDKVVLVHCHVLLRPAMMGYVIHLCNRVPMVISEHWTGYSLGVYARKSVMYRFLCRWILARSRALTLVSESLAKSMRYNHLVHAHTVIIPNVLDLEVLSSNREKTGTAVNILTVADLVDRNKNISGALQVMKKVMELHQEVIYHIIGSGEDESKIRDLAMEIDPGLESFKFYGRKDNAFVLEKIKESDFVLINSKVETFSVFAAEALALGKPVVATRCGGPEYFVDETNGLIVPAGDNEALERAVLQMINTYPSYDPGELSRAIIHRFGKAAVSHMMNDLYVSIIK